MNLVRILIMLWLGGWFILGLSIVGTSFGGEYGVLYLFTVFPAFLFIYTIKDTKRRNRTLGLFTLIIGGLIGYSASDIVMSDYNMTYTTLLGILTALILHIAFDRFTKQVANLTKQI